MADQHDEPEGSAQLSEGGIDRRTFMRRAGAAGALAGVGGLALNSLGKATAIAQTARPQPAPQTGPAEFPRPAQLRPGAQLDCRWPTTYKETIPQAVSLVTQFFAAWSE